MSNNRRRGPMGGPGRGMAPGEKAKDLKETKDIKDVGNVGFTVKIPEIIKLAEEHEKLQLALRAGDEKEIN